MRKEQIHTYKNRWKLVAEAEEKEISEAPFELLLQQTFSICEKHRVKSSFLTYIAQRAIRIQPIFSRCANSRMLHDGYSLSPAA